MVAAAIKDGSIISTSDAAAALAKMFPESTQNMQALSDRLMLAAAAAGVAVEIGPGDRSIPDGGKLPNQSQA